MMKLSKVNKTFNARNYEQETDSKKRKEIDLKYLIDEVSLLNKKLKHEEQNLHSLSNKLKKIFSSKPTSTEKNIAELSKQIVDKSKKIDFLNYNLSKIDAIVLKKKRELDNSTLFYSKFVEKLKNAFAENAKYLYLIKDVRSKNWEAK